MAYSETEIGERINDINFIGIVAQKNKLINGPIGSVGLDKLLEYLKKKPTELLK